MLSKLPKATFAVVGLSFLAPLACTAILDADVEQCRTDGDCASRGLADRVCRNNLCERQQIATDAGDAPVEVGNGIADPRWACVGSVKWENTDPSKRVNRRGRYLRLIGDQPVSGLTVRACGRVDLACSQPFDVTTTDEQGYVNVSVPAWFDGFMELPTATSFTTMVPSLSSGPPSDIDQPKDMVIKDDIAAHLLAEPELNILLAQIGQSVDPELGHIFALATDCNGAPANGVELVPAVRATKTTPYYTDTTGTPSVTSNQTAQAGEAGFVNMATGPVSLTARLAESGRKIGTYTVIVRPGTISYVNVAPTPL